MLIICSGPDTFRAREKARELTAAFKKKFDPTGQSVEIANVDEGLPAILNRLGNASLFFTKKFLRVDGLLDGITPTELAQLLRRLENDRDQTIVVTVEEGSPSKGVLEKCSSAPLFHYPFPLQEGGAFRSWVRERAKYLGVPTETADSIAQYADGNSWTAIHELDKQAVHPQEIGNSAFRENIFGVADAVIRRSSRWRDAAHDHREDNLLNIILFQLRNFFRVRDGATREMKPFIVRKLSSTTIPDGGKAFSRFLQVLVGSRTGICAGEEEVETLL
ncbi:hypothetical protein HY479_00950 [Candidatus Uhrbacteria bacterium]|nr:hypothetical protein [Candidatus Uhrbacteria bacterium]